MLRSRGLNHININVRDVARARAFYERAFGLEFRFSEGEDMVFIGTPGRDDLITLCKARASDPVAGGGVSHFGFHMDGPMDEIVAQVERAGGKLESRGEHAPGKPYAYFRDPDGYLIEIGN